MGRESIGTQILSKKIFKRCNGLTQPMKAKMSHWTDQGKLGFRTQNK